MIIAVSGSSALDRVAGIESADPTALLRLVGPDPLRHVALMAPATDETHAKRQAHVLLSARPGVRIAIVALDHHPLTLSLISAAVVRQLGDDADAGDVVDLIRRSAARSRSLVWYPRANGVPEVSPASLGQRLISLGRAAGYFREIGATAALVPGHLASPVRACDEVYVAGELPPLLHKQLDTAVRVVPLSIGPQPWTTRSAVAVSVLAGADALRSGQVCPHCDAHVGAAGCLFCGIRNSLPEHVPLATAGQGAA